MPRNYIFNRPISPHLSIYSPQLSSMFSIWHRISGVLLVTMLVTLLVIPKILVNINFSYFLLSLFLPQWFTKFTYLSFVLVFSYHALNGIRHITWDLTLFLKMSYLTLSSVVLIIFLSLILIKTISVL